MRTLGARGGIVRLKVGNGPNIPFEVHVSRQEIPEIKVMISRRRNRLYVEVSQDCALNFINAKSDGNTVAFHVGLTEDKRQKIVLPKNHR